MNIKHTDNSKRLLELLPTYLTIIGDVVNNNYPLAALPSDVKEYDEATMELIAEWNSTNNSKASLIPYNNMIFVVIPGSDLSEYAMFLDQVQETVNFDEMNIRLE